MGGKSQKGGSSSKELLKAIREEAERRGWKKKEGKKTGKGNIKWN